MNGQASILKSADQILEDLFSTLKELKSAKKKKTKKSQESDSDETSEYSSSSSSDSDSGLKKKKKKKHKKDAKKKKKHKKDDADNQNGRPSRTKKIKKSEEREKVTLTERKETSLPVPENNHQPSALPLQKEDIVNVPNQQNIILSSTNVAHRGAQDVVQAPIQRVIASNTSKDHILHKKTDHQPSSRSPRDTSGHRPRSKSPRRNSSKGPRSPAHRNSGRSRSPHRQRSRSPHGRRRSKSRSPHRRRKSRSPYRSRHRSRSPRRSPPPRSRSRRSKSPTRHRRSASPKSPKLDKAQLLEIARENLLRMQQMGTLHPSLVKHLPSNIPPVRKTVAELTDYCKQLIEQSSEEADGTDQADQEQADNST